MKTIKITNLLVIVSTLFALVITSCRPEETPQVWYPMDDLAPWRLQIRIHTCDSKDAGTDSKVWVKLTDNPNDKYYLSLGMDERDRNETNIWDVSLPTTQFPTMRDISRIELGIDGDNKWCFDKVELLINNPFDRDIAVFHTEPFVIFRSEGSFTISTKSGFRSVVRVADQKGLRQGGIWNTNGIRAAIKKHFSDMFFNNGCIVIQRTVLEEIIEAPLGHKMIAGPESALKDLKWGKKQGSKHVRIKHKDRHRSNQAQLDLDIARFAGGRLIDVQGTIEFKCVSGDLQGALKDINVSSPFWLRALSLGLSEVIADLGNMAGTVAEASIGNFNGICVTPSFDNDHNLVFGSCSGL